MGLSYLLSELLIVLGLAGNYSLALTGLSVFAAILMIICVRSGQGHMLGMLVMIAISSLTYNFLQNTTKQQTGIAAIEGQYQVPISAGKQLEPDVHGDIFQGEGGVIHQLQKGLENPSIIIFGHAMPMERHWLDRSTNYYSDLVYNFGLIVVLPILFLLIYTDFSFCSFKRKISCSDRVVSNRALSHCVCWFTKLALKQPNSSIITFSCGAYCLPC